MYWLIKSAKRYHWLLTKHMYTNKEHKMALPSLHTRIIDSDETRSA